MPQLTREYDAITAKEISPLVGWQYEYLPWPAEIEIAIYAFSTASDDTAALNATFSVFSGSDLLAQDNVILFKTNKNSGPQYPWDYNLQDIAAAGERIGIGIKVVSGTTAKIAVAVRVTPA